jgi:hypothetical protein
MIFAVRLERAPAASVCALIVPVPPVALNITVYEETVGVVGVVSPDASNAEPVFYMSVIFG